MDTKLNPIKRIRAIQLAVCAALLLGSGCDSSCDPVTSRAANSTGLIRLSDLLDQALIRTPLTEVDAASSPDQLGEIPSEVVFEENFEDYRLEYERRANSPNDAIVDTEHGKSFYLRDRKNTEPRAAWVVDVEPNAYYVFERRVKTTGTLFADVEVMEADRSLSAEKLLGGEGRRALLRGHWPSLPDANGEWETGSVVFTTLASTKTIAIALWESSRRNSTLSSQEALSETESWFDELRLKRLKPTRLQAIALLKAQDLADGANPELGLRKYGQFPPLEKLEAAPGDSSSPVDNYSYRSAFYMPPPTQLVFPVGVEPTATFRFSICLSRESAPESAARFEVSVGAGGAAEPLWSRTLTAGADGDYWHDVTLDLSAYSGCTVELHLDSYAEAGDPHPMWANPVVESNRKGDAASAALPSNVILIAVDTLRADRLSGYGYERDTSPRIDALAADGVQFDHAVSNATWTCPSFASILTGVVPSKHGVWTPNTHLPTRFETLAERFRKHGWITQAIAFKTPLYDGGYDQGFDISCIVPRQITRADENLAKAMAWLESNSTRRSFLFLHFNDPHQPFSQPRAYVRTFGADPRKVQMPYKVRGNNPKDEERVLANALYDGEVAYVDDRIGNFLEELKRRSLYDNSVIAFVSDHGEEFWEHGGLGHNDGSVYDVSVHVPLIVKPAKGSFEPGRVVDTQVRAFDVMPTLLELAGIPVSSDLDADSLVPLLSEEQPDRLSVSETRIGNFGLRTRKWKYIYQSIKGEAAIEMLFDHQADAKELNDLAANNPAIVEGFRTQVFDYLMRHRPGQYLVVIGSNSSESASDLVIRGADLTKPMLFGEVPTSDGEGVLRFGNGSSKQLRAFATVAAVGPVTVEGSQPSVKQFDRYAAGELERLLQAAQPGVYLFDGPTYADSKSSELEAVDFQQEEKMRALGYLGDE